MKKFLAFTLVLVMIFSLLPFSALAEGAETPSFATNLSTDTVNYTVGDSATALTVAVNSVMDGGTITYQWYSNEAASTEGGTELTGKTGTSYTPSTESAGTMYYYVIATNTLDGNTATATSSVATVTVAAAGVENFPYTVNFDVTEPTGWLTLDSDGDGNTWFWDDTYQSLSYDYDTKTRYTPDNYLISPVITVPSEIDKINV